MRKEDKNSDSPFDFIVSNRWGSSSSEEPGLSFFYIIIFYSSSDGSPKHLQKRRKVPQPDHSNVVSVVSPQMNSRPHNYEPLLKLWPISFPSSIPSTGRILDPNRQKRRLGVSAKQKSKDSLNFSQNTEVISQSLQD
jgi:hypothetical protein